MDKKLNPRADTCTYITGQAAILQEWIIGQKSI